MHMACDHNTDDIILMQDHVDALDAQISSAQSLSCAMQRSGSDEGCEGYDACVGWNTASTTLLQLLL